MKRVLSALISLLLLTGCTAAPTPPEVPGGTNGENITQPEEPTPSSPLAAWEDYQISEDKEALAKLLPQYTGETAADETLIKAVFDYQQQEPLRNYEWSLLPAFSKDTAPDWDSLTLYAFMMCGDIQQNEAGYSFFTAEAFGATVEKYMEGISYTPQSSSFFDYADGVYTSTGWGDIVGGTLLPVSLTGQEDGIYRMTLLGYRFWEMDYDADIADVSPLMKAIIEANGGQRPEDPQNALLGAYLDEALRETLPAFAEITLTFRLTGESDTPFRYIACERAETEG